MAAALARRPPEPRHWGRARVSISKGNLTWVGYKASPSPVYRKSKNHGQPVAWRDKKSLQWWGTGYNLVENCGCVPDRPRFGLVLRPGRRRPEAGQGVRHEALGVHSIDTLNFGCKSGTSSGISSGTTSVPNTVSQHKRLLRDRFCHILCMDGKKCLLNCAPGCGWRRRGWPARRAAPPPAGWKSGG